MSAHAANRPAREVAEALDRARARIAAELRARGRGVTCEVCGLPVLQSAGHLAPDAFRYWHAACEAAPMRKRRAAR